MLRFFFRMLKAAGLDWQVYEEVEHDSTATLQAALVVLLSSLAGGLGTSEGWAAVPFSVGAHLLTWGIWAFIIYWVGTHLLPEPETRANPGQLLRTIGFASSPGVIRILGLIPEMRTAVFWLGSIWMLVAVIVGVRQALDYSTTWRAIVVCLIGWLIQIAVIMLVTTPVS